MKPLRLLSAMLALSCASVAVAQAVRPLLQPRQFFLDQNGLPCSGCSLYTYIAGTTTPQTTYTDSTGVTPNTNPVVLDVAGGATVWVSTGHAYKFVLKNTSGVIVWTTDNVTSTGGGGSVTPPGVNGQVIYNAAGAFGAIPNSTVSNGTIGLGGPLPTYYLNFTNLSPMTTRWTLDYTTQQTFLDSLLNGGATSGTFNILGALQYKLNGVVIIPAGVTGYHGTSGTKVQLNDGTGASGNLPKYASDGSTTDSAISAALVVQKTGTPADGTCAQWSSGVLGSTGAACGTPGTGMVYPAAGGIAVYNGAGAWGTSLTAPSGTIVGTSDTQTLTNKTVDGVSPTTMAYNDATSSIQTQLNAKQATLTLTTTGSGPATLSGGALNIPRYPIANIQITTGITPISANTCTTDTGTTMTGLLATSALIPPAPTTSTVGVTGWGATGGLSLAYYVASGIFHWSVCNTTGSSITPGGSIVWNVGAR